MLRRRGLCDWCGKDRPIEDVNGLRASRDWGHGRELKKKGRGGDVANNRVVLPRMDPQRDRLGRSIQDAAEPGPCETIKGVISAPSY